MQVLVAYQTILNSTPVSMLLWHLCVKLRYIRWAVTRAARGPPYFSGSGKSVACRTLKWWPQGKGRCDFSFVIAWSVVIWNVPGRLNGRGSGKDCKKLVWGFLACASGTIGWNIWHLRLPDIFNSFSSREKQDNLLWMRTALAFMLQGSFDAIAVLLGQFWLQTACRATWWSSLCRSA